MGSGKQRDDDGDTRWGADARELLQVLAKARRGLKASELRAKKARVALERQQQHTQALLERIRQSALLRDPAAPVDGNEATSADTKPEGSES